MGERAGEAGLYLSSGICSSDLKDSVHLLQFTDGKRSPKRGTGLNASKQIMDGAGFALSSKGLHYPEKALLSLELHVGVRRHWSDWC